MRAAAFILLSLSLNAQVFYPALSWSTFLAPTATTALIAVDPQGNIFLYSSINSSQVPPCPQTSCRDEFPTQGYDLYIAKLSPDGTKLLWQRTIGGSGEDFAGALAVSPAGDVFLTGTTNSTDFPTTPGVLPTARPSAANLSIGFVIRLDAGGAIRYATLIDASISAMSADGSGALVFTGGSTWTQMSPTPGAVAMSGNSITGRLAADASRILMAVRGIGGTLLALDSAGNLVVAGTAGPDYPTTPGAFQSTVPARQCGSAFFGFACPRQFVSKLSADGQKLLFSTFVSGYSEQVFGLAADSDNTILLAGGTNTGDYPVTAGAYQTAFRSTAPGGLFGGINALNGYLTRLAADGGSLIWSTYLGGSGVDLIAALKLAPDATPWVSATLTLSDFPEFDTLGIDSHASVVLAFRRDGAAVIAAAEMPSAPQPSNVLFRSSIALDSAGGLVFATAPAPRGLTISSGVAYSNPDPVRVSSGAFLAKLDTLRPAPPVPVVRVVDAANLLPVPAIAPGQLITLGVSASLGAVHATAASPQNGFYPTVLGGTQVLFDGIPASLLYSGPGQINVAAPFGLAAKLATTVTVMQDGAAVNTQVMPVTQRAPAFFMPYGPLMTLCTIDGLGFGGSPVVGGIINNPDGSQNSCGNPAHPGDVIEFFVNGIGPAPGVPPDGSVVVVPAPALTVPLALTLKGEPIQPDSATAIAGWIGGIWRIRVRIPTDFAPNQASFTLSVDGVPALPNRIYAWVAH